MKLTDKHGDPSQKLSKEQVLAVIVSGLAYTATAGVSYIIMFYYSMYQNATGFTAGQIGNIMSVISIIATISYIFGGPLADKFRPKVLLIFCCLSTSVCSLLMITFPPYELMLPLQGLLALCALLPHWCPLAKFLTSLGKNSEQTNKIWGYYSAVVGASGALIGFICTAVLNAFDARTGMRITVLIYVALEVFCACVLPLVDKSKKEDYLEKSNDLNLKSILKIFTMPKVWLVYIVNTCFYMIGLTTMYFDPMLSNVFGVSLAMIALINTIRSNFVRILTGPLSGQLAASLHTSLKAQLVLFGIAAVGLIMMILIPWSPSTLVLALVAITIIAFAASVAYGSPNLSDAGVPDKYFGTAVGFMAVANTIPDIFVHPIAGRYVENHGTSGYKTIFFVSLCMMVVGALFNVILIRYRERELAAEKAAQ